MPLHPLSQAIGSIDGDGPKHLWNLWWMRAEFWSGTPGLRTTLVNWPQGMELYPIEPLNGLLSVVLPLPPVLLSNVLALLHLTLLGVCAGWLGRLVSGHSRGGLIAGVLAQASAFTAFTLHAGVGELRQSWWIPLGLAVAWRLREEALAGRLGWWKWGLLLAGTLTGAVLSCFYHGFFLATALSVWALVSLKPSVRLLGSYALAAGLSIAITIPIIRSFSASYGTDSRPDVSFSEWMTDWRGPVESYRGAALDPVDFFIPRTEARRPTDRQAFAYTGGRYAGITVLLLALAGAGASPRRAWPWLMVGGVSFLLALGSVPWWRGEQLLWNGERILLPLAWLNRALSFVAEPLNFPARFLSVTSLALAILGGLAGRWRGALWILPVAIADLLAGELVPWPRATFMLPDMSGLKAGEGAVFDASMVIKAGQSNQGDRSVIAGIDPETRFRAMAAQLVLKRPIQGMPVERVDHWATDGMAWARALPLSDALIEGRMSGDYRADLYLLQARGFDRILLTHDATHGPNPQSRAILDALCAEAGSAPNGSLWLIPAITATEEEKLRWIEEQQARVQQFGVPILGEQYPSR